MQRVLLYTAEEAEQLSCRHVWDRATLLGLLREENLTAAEIRTSAVCGFPGREELARTSREKRSAAAGLNAIERVLA